jgi:hypothetical protein
MERGRIARFVRTARTLLLVQLAAALLATTFAVWAVVLVRDLAAERDRLRERVSELQAQSNTAAPPLTTDMPSSGEAVAPLVLPVAIPVTDPLADTNTILPSTALPDANVALPPPQVEVPPPAEGNATQPRSRPGRWTRPVPRPTPPADAEPGNRQQPDDAP